MAVTKKIADEQQKVDWLKRRAAKRGIEVSFTKGELKAAILACAQHKGTFVTHPKLQHSALKKMQAVFLAAEIYS